MNSDLESKSTLLKQSAGRWDSALEANPSTRLLISLSG
jgi:hypothetical protein